MVAKSSYVLCNILFFRFRQKTWIEAHLQIEWNRIRPYQAGPGCGQIMLDT
jgi:hypothetical protein